MCNCNRRHKAVTSAAMAAMRANMTAEERATASAAAAIENAGGFVPVVESTPEPAPAPQPIVSETPKVTTKPAVKSTVKKS